MPEITVEEAKKDLAGLLDKQKADVQKNKESLMSEEQIKAQEAQIAADKKAADEAKVKADAAEAQAAKDAELIAKPDAEVTDPVEKKRKQELVEARKNKETVIPEDKVKKRKDEIQSEIDALIAQKKSLEDVKTMSEKMKSELAVLQQEIGALKSEREKLDMERRIPDEQKALKKKEDERVAKLLEDDAALPREERREMPRDEIEVWLTEDPVSAQEWMVERNLRRARERHADISETNKQKRMSEILSKQEESNSRVLSVHPELDTTERLKELVTQGNSKEDAMKTIFAENEKLRLSVEIFQENPGFYSTRENGPELVAQEMQKRLKVKSTSTEKSNNEKARVEELEKQVETLSAEIARLQNNDEGITSTTKGDNKTAVLGADEKQYITTLNEMGIPKEKHEAMLKKFREKKGKK
jgi:hypothetical protein